MSIVYLVVIANKPKLSLIPSDVTRILGPFDAFTTPHSFASLYSSSPHSMDISKPIAFAEHLQLSSIGIQPASISFQVHTTLYSHPFSFAHLVVP